MEKLEQTRQEIRKRKDERNLYVKSWRESQRTQRRTNSFINEYVREKFNNVYSEALKFYTALDTLYPKKLDLRKTTEFRCWKKAIRDGNNSGIITSVMPQTPETRPSTQPPQTPETQGETRPSTPPPQTPETQGETRPSTPSETPPFQLPEIGAECTVDMPSVQLESGPDSENVDQRVRELIRELQNDPDLDGFFNNLHPAEQIDEDDIFW